MTKRRRRPTPLRVLFAFLLARNLPVATRAEDGGGGYDDDGGGGADDGGYYGAATDDAAQSWADYSVLPKRCFAYNNVDVIMFSTFQYGYNQCGGRPAGTYVVPAPYFVEAYLDQQYSDAADAGNDDYERPGAAQYLQCAQMQIGDDQYWARLGCSSSKALGVKLYADDSCSTKVSVDGWDDTDIDLSDLVLPFKECQACVARVDESDDAVDDQYNNNGQSNNNSPLCSALWTYQQECDRSCQKMGHETFSSSGWNTSDKVLLSIMSVFGFGMLVAILKKRRSMSRKEMLLEEAAMSAAGLQLTHIVGIFVLVVIVIVVFALLGLKNITWALLLLLNLVLFAYLMKLTVHGGVGTSSTCGDVCSGGPADAATALPEASYIASTELPPRGFV